MATKNNKVIKSAFWYTFSNFLLKSISFITIPIFTRLLSKDDFGQFNNYLSWLQIMTVFITLNLQSSLINARYELENDLDRYTLSLFSLSALVSVIWCVCINVFSDFFMRISSLELYYINCMIVYLFFYSAFNLYQIKAKFLFEYKTNVFFNILNALLTAFLSVVLTLCLSNKLEGRILGSIIPTIVIGCIIAINFIKNGKTIKVSYWKYALKICIPYIPHTLSLVVLSSIDRIMITKMCDTEKTALYSLAYNCGIIIMLLVTSLNEAYSPWLGEKLNENKFEEIKKFSYKYIVLFLIFAFGIMLVVPEVLWILGGEKYLEAKFVLAPVALGCIYQFLYIMFVNVEQFKKETTKMALASIFAAVINYVLNYIFIEKYGYVAAAYTTAISYFILLIMHMGIVYSIGHGHVYNYNFIFAVAAGALIATIGVNALYNYTWLRWGIIGVYALILLYLTFKHKQGIIELTKSLRDKNL